MNKKPYIAPEVKKLSLEVRQAVMATCRLSGQPASVAPATDCLEGILEPCVD